MKKIDIFKNMKESKCLTDAYLRELFNLLPSQIITAIELESVIETNTSTTIKALVEIKSKKGIILKKFFIKGSGGSEAQRIYSKQNLREALFYNMIKRNNVNLPIVKCYYSYQSADPKDHLIVLKDISSEYRSPSDEDIVVLDTWYNCVKSLAQIHAAFWNHKNIEEKYLKTRSIKEQKEAERKDLSMLEEFLNKFKYKFDKKTKLILTEAMAVNIEFVKEVRQRTINKNNVTITHGDSQIDNFMLPNNSSEETILVDYQFWNKGVGTIDLAHLFRVNFPEVFKKEQLLLVSNYHKMLKNLE